MLRPTDIESKTFSTALRGYDLNEVDEFLDEVTATIRDLEDQVARAKSGGPVAAPTPAAVAASPAIDESAVGRALIAAQNAADQILADAKAEAERIRAEARTEADSWTAERDAKRAEAEREMADMSNRVDRIRRELAVLATAVADGLDQMDSLITTEDAVAGSEAEVVEDTEESEADDAEEEEKHDLASDGETVTPGGDDPVEEPSEVAETTVVVLDDLSEEDLVEQER